jgi:hypothetical protein
MSSVLGLKETQQGHALVLEGAKLPLELLDHPLALPLVDLHRCGEQPGHELRETRLVDRDLPPPEALNPPGVHVHKGDLVADVARRAAVTSPTYPAPLLPQRSILPRPSPATESQNIHVDTTE